MQAVIMAGGKGTRLLELTKNEIPKPMTPICGKPILQWQVDRLKENGITDIIMIIGHLGHKIIEYFGDGSAQGLQIRYIEEKNPLGTAGAFFYLREMLTEPEFLLVFGDVLFDIDLQRMYRFHIEKRSFASLYILNYLKCKLKIESLCILNNTGDEWEKAARNLGISIVTTNKNDVKTINRYDGVVITEQLGTIESKRNFDFSSNIIITYIECSSPLEAETRLAIKSQMKYMIDCYDENGYVGIPLYDTLKDIWEIKEQYIYSLIVFVKRDSLDADGEVYEGLSNNTRKDLN